MSEEDSFELFLLEKKPHVAEPHLPLPRVAQLSRHDEVFEVSMEKWLEFVEEQSFATRFVPISTTEARALLRWLQAFDIIGGRVKQKHTPDAEDVAVVSLLAQRITEALSAFPGNQGFVKLSSRSPKDAVFDCWSDKTARLVDAELQKARLGDDNDECKAFFAAANKAMCCANGEEAIDLFQKSARVREDLGRALKREQFDLMLVCREFVDMPLHSEFRGFVFEKRLVALSQYFWFSYFPELVARHNDYLDRIVCFFEKEIRPRVSYANYVVDVACLENRIYVIELNPFGDVRGKKCAVSVFLIPLGSGFWRMLLQLEDGSFVAARAVD